MYERKRLPFRYGRCTEMVAIRVSEYESCHRLYVGLTSHNEEFDFEEPFAHITVNITRGLQGPNDSYIDCNDAEDLMTFIVENALGKPLPQCAILSLDSIFPAVEFDLERLREFDPIGVESVEENRELRAWCEANAERS